MDLRGCARSQVTRLDLRPLLRPQLGRRDVSRHLCIDDFRDSARRSLPRSIFDYVDGGADSESTVRRNRAAFDEIDLVPRVLRDMTEIDLRTELLGCPASLPLALAPTGATGFVRRGGELDVVRAAGASGIPYSCATGITVDPEVVATLASAPVWFQRTRRGDEGWSRELIARAREAGFSALLVTVDNAAMAWRRRDLRNGTTLPPTIRWATVLDGVRHPAWSWQFLRGEPLELPNFPLAYTPGAGKSAAERIVWSDLDWIAEAWGGPPVLKGILTAADARAAADVGIRAIVVSNHGGRQLDGARATIDALPEIAEAVGDRVEILLDSGVRTGVDILRALCLGAKGCLIGRPYLYALAAGGQAGVERAVDLLANELRRAMAHVGVASVDGLGPEYVS